MPNRAQRRAQQKICPQIAPLPPSSAEILSIRSIGLLQG